MIKRIYKNIPVSIKIIWLILVANLVNVVLDPVVPSILVLCFVFIIFTFAAVNMGYQAQKSEYKDIGTSKEAFKTNCEYFWMRYFGVFYYPIWSICYISNRFSGFI